MLDALFVPRDAESGELDAIAMDRGRAAHVWSSASANAVSWAPGTRVMSEFAEATAPAELSYAAAPGADG
jgi:hypothetical protein